MNNKLRTNYIKLFIFCKSFSNLLLFSFEILLKLLFCSSAFKTPPSACKKVTFPKSGNFLFLNDCITNSTVR